MAQQILAEQYEYSNEVASASPYLFSTLKKAKQFIKAFQQLGDPLITLGQCG